MGKVTKYFGNETMKLCIDNANEHIKDFKSQTNATKLD